MNHPSQSVDDALELQPRWVTYLWLSMVCYILGFGYYAWIDLYAPQSIEGLYRTHHSPYESEAGLVIDPNPSQHIRNELQQRLNLKQPIESNEWSVLSAAVSDHIVSRQLRVPNHDELVLAKDENNKPLLLINKYRDSWVLFRDQKGVILSTQNIDETLQEALVLSVTEIR